MYTIGVLSHTCRTRSQINTRTRVSKLYAFYIDRTVFVNGKFIRSEGGKMSIPFIPLKASFPKLKMLLKIRFLMCVKNRFHADGLRTFAGSAAVGRSRENPQQRDYVKKRTSVRFLIIISG